MGTVLGQVVVVVVKVGGAVEDGDHGGGSDPM